MKVMNGFPLGGRTLRVGPASSNGPTTVVSTATNTNTLDVGNSISKEEDLSISGNERFLVMQKLARGSSSTSCKTISLKNMVTPEEIYDADLEEEITSECSNYGKVEKVIIYQDPTTNNEVIVFVSFDTPESAAKAINALHKRWFAKRMITAELAPNLPNISENK